MACVVVRGGCNGAPQGEGSLTQLAVRGRVYL